MANDKNGQQMSEEEYLRHNSETPEYYGTHVPGFYDKKTGNGIDSFKKLPLALDYLEAVAEFHRTFNSPILPAPQIPDQARCDLRMSLLQEELKELIEGIENKDIVEVADAFADLQYVLSGAILEFGLQDKFPALFAEVHRSNMSKACTSYEEAVATCEAYVAKDNTSSYIVSEKGRSGRVHIVYRMGDHKTLKSINYSPADLKSIIES